MKRLLRLGALSLVLLSILGRLARAADTPMGTAFTYQGRLTNAGSPTNDTVDIKFTLYDAATAGTLLGTTTIPGIVVRNGLFTVKLDFGPLGFKAGAARWLEIQVAPPGGPTLTPRQELTPQTYSIFSSYTDPANLTNLNAANITSGTVPSSALAGPYSNAVTLSSAGNVFVGDGSGLTNLNAQAKYVRTVVVSPVGDGSSAAANGTALLAALAGITTASATNHWLLKIEPGLYDLGSGSLVMKSFVDVEGSGEVATRIRAAGHATNDIGTVQVVNQSELRFLTVESTGGAAYAKAVYVHGAVGRITHVTAVSSGGTAESQGFFFDSGATPNVVDATANVSATGGASSFGVLDVGSSSSQFHVVSSASGGTYSTAFWSCCGSGGFLRDSSGGASGGSTESRGMVILDSSPFLDRVNLVSSGGGSNSTGFVVGGSASPTARQLTCRASGGATLNTGCLVYGGAQPSLVDVQADATGGTQARGIDFDSVGANARLSRALATASGASTEDSGVRINNSALSVSGVDTTANGGGSANVYGLLLSGGSPNLSQVTAAAAASTGAYAGAVWVTGGTPTLSHLTATASCSSGFTWGIAVVGGTLTVDGAMVSASGPNQAVGVYSVGGVTLNNITATASGTGGTVGGMFNNPTLIRLANAKLLAQAAPSFSFGLDILGSAGTVTVDRSSVSGGTSIYNQGPATVHVAESQLEGVANNASTGTLTCLRGYNSAYASLNSTCQ